MPYYSKVAVPLKENAFDEFDIRFNPKFPDSEKVGYLREMHDLLPESKITVLERLMHCS